MLTDYHVHLRTDALQSAAEQHFTAQNVERYLTVARELGIEELGASEHVYRFVQALDVWRHPFWQRYASDDLDHYCAFVREQTDLKLGIEADFVAGREDRIASLLEARDFDYVIGSVHFIAEKALDMDDHTIWDGSLSAEQIWRRYFETVAESARSRLFDIIAHPDLVKVWGAQRPTPEGDLRRYYEPAVEAIAEAGVAIEVSTAGLRKQAKEIYPAPPFLSMCVAAGIPVALSSDAHVPSDVGAGYRQALELLRDVGVSELCVFSARKRTLEPIGASEL